MADTKEILKGLNWRYATKEFDTSKKLSDDQISFLKEVLRLSPSSFGMQPWKFLFIRDAELREKLHPKAWNQAQVKDASDLIVLCRKTNVGQEEVDKLVNATGEATGVAVEVLSGYKDMLSGFVSGLSDEARDVWTEKQIYIALGNLLSACAQVGIDACPMEGFEKAAFDEILGLEAKGLRSTVLVTVGTRLDTDKYATRGKVRFPLKDVVETL